MTSERTTSDRDRTDVLITTVAVIGGLVGAGGVLAAALTSTEGDVSAFVVGVMLWALSPFAGLLGAAALARRRFRAGRVALLVAGVAALGVGVVAAIGLATSESSTAALGVLWFPVVQWGLVLAGLVAAVLVHRGRA